MSHPDDDITILTEARDMVHGLRKQRAIARRFGMQMERERDEARKAFAIATTTCVDVQQRLRVLERERVEARADHDHLITISRDRLEKIRVLEREIETLRPSNLPPLS